MPNGPDKLPRLAVADTKFIKGISRLTDPADAMQVMPLRDALATRFGTDAHFCCYSVTDNGVEAEAWPRLNKVVLDAIEAANGRVFCTMLVIDYDTKDNLDAERYQAKKDGEGKVAWDDELIEEFWLKLDAATEDNGLPMPNVVYTTKNGARFIYVLPEPMLVREVEDYHRGLVHTFGKAGLTADEKCSDWTRFFRMPNVMRDGKASWDSPYFRMLEQWDTFIDVANVPKIEKASSGDTYAPLRSIDRPRPTQEDARKMLEVQGGADMKLRTTQLFKEAKRRMQGRNSFGCLFDMQPIAREGERDAKLTSYVGETVAVLFPMDGASPELIYALFLPAVEQLKPDAGNPNWLDKLWYLVTYAWTREVAKDEARQQKSKVVEVRKVDALGAMLQGMRSWCKSPELEGDDASATIWMLTHSIVMTRARKYHVLRPSGFFSRHGVPREHLVTEIRESGLSQFISLEKQVGGETVPVSPGELLAVHGTQVHEVLGAANYAGSIVKSIGTPDATLVLSLYGLRRDLEPTYSNEVDIWLKKLVGEEQVQVLRDWIGFALDFEGGPICALSVSGPPGCGKKMLVRGLAECINTGMVASGLDLVQRFTPTLMKTPFLCVDEGLPSKIPGGIDIADQFRRVVSGESITLDVKFGDPVTVFNPLRVIFTANNLETVRAITSHRDLTPEDQAALSQRIMHVDVRQQAADWLAANGGIKLTKGWIQGDSGEDSRYVVAKHFLWLHQQRPKQPKGTRLLVEGNLDSELMRDMRTQSGIAPLVIRTLIYMIEAPNKQNMKGLSIEDGRVYVTASGVVEVYRADLSNRRDVNTSQVMNVLRSVVMPGGAKSPTYHVNATGERIKARWHLIDLVTLLEEAYSNGYPSRNIENLLHTQFGSEADAIIEGLSK